MCVLKSNFASIRKFAVVHFETEQLQFTSSMFGYICRGRKRNPIRLNLQKEEGNKTDKFMLLAILTTNYIIVMFIYIKIYVCIVHHLPLAYDDGKMRRGENFNFCAFCFDDKLKAYSLFHSENQV